MPEAQVEARDGGTASDEAEKRYATGCSNTLGEAVEPAPRRRGLLPLRTGPGLEALREKRHKAKNPGKAKAQRTSGE